MLEPYKDEKIDIVVGMESRGFIFSSPMAYQLNAGLVPVRKLGKLPAETITVEYALEYGSNTLEIHRDAIQAGQKVLIVDDLLATGGTVQGHDRARRAAEGRGRRAGVPRRARLPQGSRPAPGPARHERHQVLTRTGTDRDTGMSEPADPAEGGPDLGRRRFFRQFAGDLANTAATVVGAAQVLQRTSAELAKEILDPAKAALEEAQEAEAEAAVFRTSFRLDGATIVFVDQRALPRAVVENAVASSAEVTYAIRNGTVLGGPAIGQAAAVGLALTAARVRATRPYARRATLRGAANGLRTVSPTQAGIAYAVDRVMGAYHAIGDLDEDGDAIAAAMRAEADRIIAEAAADHGRLVDVGLAAMAEVGAADGPLSILVHGRLRRPGGRPVRDGPFDRDRRPSRRTGRPGCRSRRPPRVHRGPDHVLGAVRRRRSVHARRRRRRHRR